MTSDLDVNGPPNALAMLPEQTIRPQGCVQLVYITITEFVKQGERRKDQRRNRLQR